MKRSLQEVVELVVFGLIALLLGTGLLWLVGAVFGLVGTVLGWLAGLLWALLRFVVPVALVAGAVVLLVRAARGREDATPAASDARVATPTTTPTVDAEPPTPVATPEEAASPDDGATHDGATNDGATRDVGADPSAAPADADDPDRRPE